MNESTALVVVDPETPPRVIGESDYRLAIVQIKDYDDPIRCRRVAAQYEAVANAFRKSKDDPTTVYFARRLQLWALRRCGELVAPCRAIPGPAWHPHDCECCVCVETPKIRRAADLRSTQKGVARFLGISVDTIKRMISLSVIPYGTFEAAVEQTPPPAFQTLASMAPRLRVIRTPPPPPTPPTPPRKSVSRTKAATRDRIETMARLAAEGHASEQIAAIVGINAAHVRLVLRREGVDLPADRALGGRQTIDARRMVEAIVSHAETLTDNVALINFHDLPAEDCGAWLTRLRGAQQNLARFIKQLTRVTINKGGAVWQAKTEK